MEYPIFSNKLPSFEYSIYECVDQEEAFASGLDNPSGLALSSDGERLFVAERSGRILALDAESGMVMQSIDLAGFRIHVDRRAGRLRPRLGRFTSRT